MAIVKQTCGSIGYVEYSYTEPTGASVALLENKGGVFVDPGPESGAAAIESATFPNATLPSETVPDLRAWAYDPPGNAVYPIATFTRLIFPRR